MALSFDLPQRFINHAPCPHARRAHEYLSKVIHFWMSRPFITEQQTHRHSWKSDIEAADAGDAKQVCLREA